MCIRRGEFIVSELILFSVDAAQIIRYDAFTMVRNHLLITLSLTLPLA